MRSHFAIPIQEQPLLKRFRRGRHDRGRWFFLPGNLFPLKFWIPGSFALGGWLRRQVRGLASAARTFASLRGLWLPTLGTKTKTSQGWDTQVHAGRRVPRSGVC